MVATITEDSSESMPKSIVQVRLTTTATTDTYICPYFNSIDSAVGNNESDSDGVGVAVSGKTITLTVGTAGDVVTLLIAGKF